ncbi:MAG: CRISPR-associated protein Cas4 [Ardenticatenaceae bacterium]|nr:CRISPR-associated protein Cas4 [Anaerolineales bacterium]MCB8922206.1 CRISPR-associated protein Cas4 [Ardenticatenaceae bacterium]
MEDLPFTFQVTALKQYVYCPRILYYQTVLPQVRPVTYKMEAGIEAHLRSEGWEKRRSLRAYGLDEGERFFNVPLLNTGLMLSGEVDMVIQTAVELIPVDFKHAKRVGKHYKLQLMAYGRLLELADPKEERQVKRGFLYLIPGKKAVEVRFTPALRRQLDKSLETMHDIAHNQRVPGPAASLAQCIDCEFRRFCNDLTR